MDLVAVVRGIVAALVGGFLIVYAVVAHPMNRVVIGVAGLVLLGIVSLDQVAVRRRDE